MTAAWRDEELDEEGRPYARPERPLNAQDWALVALVVAMVVVCLALAGGGFR